MERPQRIQRKRTAGWRMPPNTVYVGRPSQYQNDFDWQIRVEVMGETPAEARRHVVEQFRAVWTKYVDEYATYLNEIRGKNLACWCPLDQPCHADVLLELANSDAALRAAEQVKA